MKKLLIIIAIVVIVVGLVSIRVISQRRCGPEAASAKANLLGISVREITESDRAKLGIVSGVMVNAVNANSPAERQGLRSNDVILAINDESLEKECDYQEALDKALMQKSMTFTIKRGSEEIKVRFNTEYASSYNKLGSAYVREKRYGEAIESYKMAIDIDPDFAEAYYNLGSVYEKQKDYDTALEYYKKALSRRKDFREAQHKLTEIYSKQGKYEEAVKTYKEILPSAPSDTITSDLQVVEVIRAVQGEIRNQLKTSGTIEPRAQITIFPKVAGVIQETKVDQGDTVRKDQVLAVVEHEELELQIQQAEAAFAAAKSAYDQALQLAQVRTMSQVAQARAGLEVAEAALQQVRDLAETRTETQIQQAKSALDALTANLEKIRSGAREEEREQILATLAQAEAGLTNAQNNYERMQKLFEQRAISKQTYEGSETQLEVAKAQHRVAKQQWKLIEEGAREEDIRALEAQVKQAEAVFRLAQMQADKQTWQKDIAMAEAQAKQARAALDSAETLVKAKSWEAEITAAETQLTQARVMRDLARKRLSDAYIKAPIKGVVSIRHMDKGSMANPAAPMFDLVDMDIVHANVDIIESDLSKIQLKNDAWIHLSALDEPVKGRVTSISPIVDEVSRTAQLEVTVDNKDHLLKPGMFAQVFIPMDVRPSAVLLPRSVVIEDETNGEKYVFVVNSGKSKRIPVEYGLTEGNLVEIVKGLDVGDTVVFSGQQNLKDGDFVQVVNVIEEL